MRRYFLLSDNVLLLLEGGCRGVYIYRPIDRDTMANVVGQR